MEEPVGISTFLNANLPVFFQLYRAANSKLATLHLLSDWAGACSSGLAEKFLLDNFTDRKD
jgi:hypothetical protein